MLPLAIARKVKQGNKNAIWKIDQTFMISVNEIVLSNPEWTHRNLLS